jgi:hypothetical protein
MQLALWIGVFSKDQIQDMGIIDTTGAILDLLR